MKHTLKTIKTESLKNGKKRPMKITNLLKLDVRTPTHAKRASGELKGSHEAKATRCARQSLWSKESSETL